jgi:hypothetical protein
MTKTTTHRPTSTKGYTYFTIYRAHSVYYNPNAERYTYAAGKADGEITIFDTGFAEIRAQLDEITRESGREG